MLQPRIILRQIQSKLPLPVWLLFLLMTFINFVKLFLRYLTPFQAAAAKLGLTANWVAGTGFALWAFYRVVGTFFLTILWLADNLGNLVRGWPGTFFLLIDWVANFLRNLVGLRPRLVLRRARPQVRMGEDEELIELEEV